MSDKVLHQLAVTLAERKVSGGTSGLNSGQTNSYVASLYAGGDDAILKKVGEEVTEVILAAKGDNAGQFDPAHLVMETADLWFHTMVLLAHKDVDVSDVLTELESRFGRSGLDEKAARNTKED